MKFDTSIERRLSGRHLASLKIGNFKGKKVLDIGSSFGWFEKYSDAKRIVAIDLVKKDIEIAKKEVKRKNVEFKVGSVFDVEKFTREKFDFIVMFDVIEHLPKNNEVSALKKLKSVLKKNGNFILTTPCNNLTDLFDPAWYFGHRHYSESKLKKIFMEAGFKIEKNESKGGFWEIFSMLLFYPCKWLLNSEIPFKKWFDKKRNDEYLRKKKGFVTWFIIAKKQD